MHLSSFKEYRDHLRKSWKKARRDLEPDSIHDLRVASRRMGALLLLMEAAVGDDQSSKARRRLKQVMKKLGPLRDVQVQIAIVKKWKKATGVERFKASLESFEQQERDRADRYLSTDRKKKILRDLKDFEKDAAERLKKVPQATMLARIRSTVAVQRTDLEATRRAMRPSDPRSLHAVRRAARKLRYCLEAGGESSGKASQSEIEQLRRQQTQLGNKRDRQLLAAKFEGWQAQLGNSGTGYSTSNLRGSFRG